MFIQKPETLEEMFLPTRIYNILSSFDHDTLPNLLLSGKQGLGKTLTCEILSKKLGREIEREEIFVDYEEGKNMFPNKSTWQNQSSYPALRVDFYNPKLPCIFYNTKVRACSIYDIRPKTCQEYECEYLTQNT